MNLLQRILYNKNKIAHLIQMKKKGFVYLESLTNKKENKEAADLLENKNI